MRNGDDVEAGDAVSGSGTYAAKVEGLTTAHSSGSALICAQRCIN